MKKLIIADWKMNPQHERDAVRLAKATDFHGVVIAPPYPFIPAVSKVLKKAELGLQDIFWEVSGAYTGEVSPTMARDFNASYVILGHSERRRYLNETDEMINKKVASA